MGKRRVASATLAMCCWMLGAGALAAEQRPVVTLNPQQEAKLKDTYYNCDHEGSFGCLRLLCRQSRADRAEIQYLYRDVFGNFPEFLTPDLRACFTRAGGRFR